MTTRPADFDEWPELQEATPERVRDLCVSLMVERGRLLAFVREAVAFGAHMSSEGYNAGMRLEQEGLHLLNPDAGRPTVSP